MSHLADGSKAIGKEVAKAGIYGIGLYFLLNFFMVQFSSMAENQQTNIENGRAADLVQAAALDKIGDGTIELAREVRGFARETDDVADAVVALRKTIERNHPTTARD